jgi:hypothetical protein
MEKSCVACNQTKSLTEFYPSKVNAGGHLTKCKECTKKESIERYYKNRLNPEWVEKTKKRTRTFYSSKGQKAPRNKDPEYVRIKNQKTKERYPEKVKAMNATRVMRDKTDFGINLHHWSYNEEHYKDVIQLKTKEHTKAHRFIVYDQERMMYRRFDTNELLDTKERHEEFIRYCILTKED